jgi:hypothetical protein
MEATRGRLLLALALAQEITSIWTGPRRRRALHLIAHAIAARSRAALLLR